MMLHSQRQKQRVIRLARRLHWEMTNCTCKGFAFCGPKAQWKNPKDTSETQNMELEAMYMTRQKLSLRNTKLHSKKWKPEKPVPYDKLPEDKKFNEKKLCMNSL